MTDSSHNTIQRVHVHDFKTLLGDGGGLYALGPQPHSSMEANWAHGMGSGRGGGAFYPDEGSTDWDIRQTVFSDAASCADNCEWLHVWTKSIRDIVVDGAWTDTRTMRNDGTNCTVRDVSYVDVKAGATFPPAARAIMSAAGPTSRFVPWARPPPPPPPLWLPMARAVRAQVSGGAQPNR